MLPAELLNALQAYALNRDPLPSGASPVPQSPSLAQSLQVGQQVQGTVVAELSPGVFTVRVASQLVQMPLPQGAASGSAVTLQVASLQPRLVFNLVAPQNSTLTTTESSPQIGTTAQMLSDLMQNSAGTVTNPRQSAPLALPGEPLTVSQLAHTLQQTLTTSGLFYESHQAQWVGGQHSTAQLQAEPQNQPAQTVVTPVYEFSQPTSAPPTTRQLPTAAVVSTPGGGGLVSSAQVVSSAGTGQAAASVIPSHLQVLVQQQLGVLETGKVVWQGYLMPGQPLNWHIWPESSHSGTAQEPAVSVWHTEVQLELPALGTVTARLKLDGHGVTVNLGAVAPSTRQTLMQQSSDLVGALQAAGITVVGALVSADPATVAGTGS
ncbi:MAG: hypothetical protein G3I09_07840 [Ferrovum sp.]|nr:hypothetical protein [Ferrovum sp.]